MSVGRSDVMGPRGVTRMPHGAGVTLMPHGARVTLMPHGAGSGGLPVCMCVTTRLRQMYEAAADGLPVCEGERRMLDGAAPLSPNMAQSASSRHDPPAHPPTRDTADVACASCSLPTPAPPPCYRSAPTPLLAATGRHPGTGRCPCLC